MPVFYDQLNRKIDLPYTPKRVISVVPSQTELLFYLGLDNAIAGITNFCIHPADKTKTLTKIGGTKKLNTELIKQLNPDLIIANKEENERSQIEELMQLFPVWISDINDLPGALDMIQSTGQMLDREDAATTLISDISRRFAKLPGNAHSLQVAYLIWRKPYMAAGSDTFINNMLQLCGLQNVFDQNRYPEVTAQMLIAAKPDVILLSSEPYPFGDKHIAEFKAMVPDARIILVDGEMFSWYGSRLLHAPGYFEGLLTALNKLE